MDEDISIAQAFEAHRRRLKAIANRMLGSPSDADDAVQEAWIRFSRADTSTVENLRAWLTTVVSRVCLNMLDARRSRPMTATADDLDEQSTSEEFDPEHEALLTDSLGIALLVVLDSLAPAERVALILHDMFGVPFEEVAPIVGRSVPAARQLASRARQRVRGANRSSRTDRVREASLVEAFLAASHLGDFDGLLALLDPDVVLHADAEAVKLGVGAVVRGAAQVAEVARQASGAQPVLVDGRPGAAWMPIGRPRMVLLFSTVGQRVSGIEVIADPDRLAAMQLVVPAVMMKDPG